MTDHPATNHTHHPEASAAAHDHPRRFSPALAHRLEAPERKLWLPIEPVLAQMDLAPGIAVADIGVGTGYFALPIAQAIGGSGRVAAVDVSPEMLDLLGQKIVAAGLTNIDCVQAESASTGLASASFDRVLLANVWHEVDDRPATLAEAARLLRPGGRVAILDWSPDVVVTDGPESTPPSGPPLAHRIALLDVQHELVEHGWNLVSAGPTGKYSWLVLATPPRATT